MALDEKSTYYDAGGIEVINVIRAKLTEEQLTGYFLGNVIKYSCRLNFKNNDSGKRDAEKIQNYSALLEAHTGDMETDKEYQQEKLAQKMMLEEQNKPKLVPVNYKSSNLNGVTACINTAFGQIHMVASSNEALEDFKISIKEACITHNMHFIK